MSKRYEELLKKHGANRYLLLQKVTHANFNELKHITEWKEYKDSLVATGQLEKYEMENKNPEHNLLDVTDGFYERNNS